MKWTEVREKYRDSWVLIEALEAHSENGERIVDKISVLNYFETSQEALKVYEAEHKKNPNKELYVYHTQNEVLKVKERIWMGARRK